MGWIGGLARDYKVHKLLAAHGRGAETGRGALAAAPPAPTVAACRSFAGIELQSTVSKSEGTGRERKMRGFHFGDSGHGRRAGRRPAMDGHGGGSGSSWGAR